jgi:hypothetical protein
MGRRRKIENYFLLLKRLIAESKEGINWKSGELG